MKLRISDFGFRIGCAVVAMLLLVHEPVTVMAQRPPADTQPAGPGPFRVWAVLCTDELHKSGFDDLVQARLATDRTITLVDRQRLAAVAGELSLAELAGPTGLTGRSRAGRLLGADALAILNQQRAADGGEFARLVVCDVRSGARLLEEYVPLAREQAELAATRVATAIAAVRQRFPAGIRRVFGVPPFVSRSLTHEYDYLQRGYSSLLSSALGMRQGVAVIEVDDARRIARESALGDGQDVRRVVPLFVEGEIEVARGDGGPDPQVAIRVKVVGGGDGPAGRHAVVAGQEIGIDKGRLSERKVRLSEAADYITGPLADRVSGLAPVAAGNPLTARQQFAALVERADAFARLGGWEHSTGLREAALLLHDNLRQRDKLIQEYCWITTAGWPRGTVLGDEAWRARVSQRAELWLTALAHVEYIIRNGQISQPEAAVLTDKVLHSAFSLRVTPNDAVPPMERAKRRFLRQVFPLARSLPATGPASLTGRTGWGDVLFEYALINYESNAYRPDDFDFIFEIITQVLPADCHLPNKLVYFITGYAGVGGGEQDPARQMYAALLDKMVRSDRPVCRVLARYAILWRQWCREQKSLDLAAFNRQVEQLLADYQMLEPTLTRTDSSFDLLRDQIKDLVARVRFAMKPKIGPPTPPQWREPPSPIALERIELRLKPRDGRISAMSGTRWRAPHGWGGIEHIVNCGDAGDVFWQNGMIAVMREKGLVEEMVVDPKAWISDVKWDGRNLWAATRWGGVWVLSLDGKLVARMGQAEGLPSGEKGMMVRPFEPGKAIVAGALGEHDRLWLAVAQYDDRGAKATVFHEATRVLAANENWWRAEPDVNWAGAPHWTHLLAAAGKDGSRAVLVGRGSQRRPIQVDVATLKVSLYPGDFRPGRYQDDECFFSRAGRLYETGQDSQFLPVGRELYEQGIGVWYRVDLGTGKRQEIGRLPSGYDLRRFGISSHYGLVGWSGDGGFYRLTVQAGEAAGAHSSPTSQPAAADQRDAPLPVLFARSGQNVIWVATPHAKVAVRAFGRTWAECTGNLQVESGRVVPFVAAPAVRVPTVFMVTPTDDAKQALGELVVYPDRDVEWDKSITVYSCGGPAWFEQWAAATGLPVKQVAIADLASAKLTPADEKMKALLILGPAAAGRDLLEVAKLAAEKGVSVLVLDARWFGESAGPVSVAPSQMREGLSEIAKQRWPQPLKFASHRQPWPGIANRWAWIADPTGLPLVEELRSLTSTELGLFPPLSPSSAMLNREPKGDAGPRVSASYVPWFELLGRSESADDTLLALLAAAGKASPRDCRWSPAELVCPKPEDLDPKARPVLSAVRTGGLWPWPGIPNGKPAYNAPINIIVDLRGPPPVAEQLQNGAKGLDPDSRQPITCVLILGDDKMLDEWNWLKLNRDKKRIERTDVVWLPDDELPPSREQQIRLMLKLTELGVPLAPPEQQEKKK